MTLYVSMTEDEHGIAAQLQQCGKIELTAYGSHDPSTSRPKAKSSLRARLSQFSSSPFQ